MYIDIALTPAEERLLLAGFLLLTLIGVVLLVRPRFFARGLGPLLRPFTGRGDRKSSQADGGGAGKSGFPLSVKSEPKRSTWTWTWTWSFSSWRTSWTKRVQAVRRTIDSNPTEFHSGVVSYWPIPTWSAWTTYSPILGWLAGVFEDELDKPTVVELDAGLVTPLEEGSRKGSVGLGIVGVDVVKPITSTTIGEEKEEMQPVYDSSSSGMGLGISDGPPASTGFFPADYDMSLAKPSSAPISLLGAPLSPSDNSHTASPLLNRRLPPSPNPEKKSAEVEPELIPFTPFPKPPNRPSMISRFRRWLLWSYTHLAGPVCLLVMGLGVGLMILQAGQGWGRVWRIVIRSTGGVADQPEPGRLGKRGMSGGFPEGDGMTGVYRPEGRGDIVQPLIPGWTIPLSHIFPLVGTLLCCQIIHETGHIIAGAMNSIIPTRLAFNLHLIIPAASVTFPNKHVSDLSPTSRIKMAASGPWNNLLTFLLLTVMARTGISTLFYHDYTPQGRVVLDIQSTSALRGHIPAGSIVEFLDDVPLSGPSDVWGKFLLTPIEEQGLDESRGWCIDKKRYLGSTVSPCPEGVNMVEFTSLPINGSVIGATAADKEKSRSKYKGKGQEDKGVKRCLPAYPLLTSRTWSCPCSSASQICVRPVMEEKIVRIQWRDPGESGSGSGSGSAGGDIGGKEDGGPVVVLWSGERREVWDVVRVSRWAGRGGTAGRWVVGWVELVYNYMATLSLSLAILNVLPLPRLDGAHMVEATLDQLYPTTTKTGTTTTGSGPQAEETVEEGLGPMSIQDQTTQRKRTRIERCIEYGSLCLAVVAIGGGLLAAILEVTLL